MEVTHPSSTTGKDGQPKLLYPVATLVPPPAPPGGLPPAFSTARRPHPTTGNSAHPASSSSYSSAYSQMFLPPGQSFELDGPEAPTDGLDAGHFLLWDAPRGGLPLATAGRPRGQLLTLQQQQQIYRQRMAAGGGSGVPGSASAAASGAGTASGAPHDPTMPDVNDDGITEGDIIRDSWILGIDNRKEHAIRKKRAEADAARVRLEASATRSFLKDYARRRDWVSQSIPSTVTSSAMGHIAAAAAAPARCSACATAAAAGQPPPQPSCLECPPVDPSAAAASISPSSAGGTEPGGPVAPPTPIAEPPSRVLAFGRVRVGPLGPGAAQSVPPDFGSAFAAPSPHQVKYSSPATTGSGVHPPAGADPALPASDGLPQPVTMTPGPVPSSSSSSPTAAIAAAAAAAAAAHVGGEVAPVPQVAVTEPPVFEGVGPRPLVATRDLAGRRVASPGTSSKPVITVRQTGFQVTSTPLPGATVSGSLLSSSPVGGRSPSPASGGLSSSPLTSFVQSGGFATNTGGPGSTGAPVRAHATPVFSPPLSPSTSPMSTAAIGTATMTVTTAATPASAIAGVAATTAPPTVIDAGLGKVASSSGPSVQPFPQADVGRPTSALTATIQAKSTRQDQPIRARRDSVINDILNQQWHRESDTGSGPSLSHATQS